MSARPSPPSKIPPKGDLRGTLAYRVRTLRVERGWSQERLGEETGLDRTYVSAVERSVWNVSLGNIELLARAFEVEPWTLLLPVDQ